MNRYNPLKLFRSSLVLVIVQGSKPRWVLKAFYYGVAEYQKTQNICNAKRILEPQPRVLPTKVQALNPPRTLTELPKVLYPHLLTSERLTIGLCGLKALDPNHDSRNHSNEVCFNSGQRQVTLNARTSLVGNSMN